MFVPLADQAVVGIGQCDHLRRDGDAIALQAVGEAAAVPALMMPAADLERELHQRLVLILGQIFQHLRTQNRVGVEDGGLFRRQVVGVEDAVVDTLMIKCRRALEQTGFKRLVMAGGVSANRTLRAKLAEMMQKRGGEVFYARPEFCTDNGAMIAAQGYYEFKDGNIADLTLNGLPTLAIDYR